MGRFGNEIAKQKNRKMKNPEQIAQGFLVFTIEALRSTTVNLQ